MHILKRNNQQDETKILQKNQRRRSRGSNNKFFKTKEAACISFLLQREAYATAIYIRINSKGGGKHPCLTHMAMSKGPVSFLSCIHNNVNKLTRTPQCFNRCYSVSLFSLSNAFISQNQFVGLLLDHLQCCYQISA